MYDNEFEPKKIRFKPKIKLNHRLCVFGFVFLKLQSSSKGLA